MDITCPVCGLKSIIAEKTQCPQCDADLSSFQVLESLPDELITDKNNSSSRNFIILISTLVLFLGLISFLVLSRHQQIESQQIESVGLLAEIKNQLTYLEKKHTRLLETSASQRTTIDQMKSEMKALTHFVRQLGIEKPDLSYTSQEGRINKDSLLLTQSPVELKKAGSFLNDLDFWTYEINEQDTLWQLAKRYYGFGHYYPVLLEHNSHIGIYTIRQGMQIKVLKDTSLAKKIYAGIIHEEGNRIYWKYTIVKGDTFISLAKRFSKLDIPLTTNLDFDQMLRPGGQIKIMLD